MTSCPSTEVQCRLALHIMCFSNPKAVAVLWQRFVRHLREACWDTHRLLPRMNPPSSGPHSGPEASTPLGGADQDVRASGLPRPDFNCCLLHQKLQMLNLCIHQAHKLQPQQTPGPDTLQVQGYTCVKATALPIIKWVRLIEHNQLQCMVRALQVLVANKVAQVKHENAHLYCWWLTT